MARAARQVPVGRRLAMADRRRLEIRSMSDMARDPVCSMAVSAQSPVHFAFEGSTYHFCSQGCREEFAAEPEQFLDRPPAFGGASATDPQSMRKEESP